MNENRFLLLKLGLFIVLFLPIIGCWPTGEMKSWNSLYKFCPDETNIGDALTFGTKIYQDTFVAPGLLKFRFNVNPVDHSQLPPNEYRMDFKYQRKKQVLFTDSLNIFTREDGSIPYQTFEFLGFDFRKNDRLTFDFFPLDRKMPLSNVTLRYRYNYLVNPPLSNLGFEFPPNRSQLLVFYETEYLQRVK